MTEKQYQSEISQRSEISLDTCSVITSRLTKVFVSVRVVVDSSGATHHSAYPLDLVFFRFT